MFQCNLGKIISCKVEQQTQTGQTLRHQDRLIVVNKISSAIQDIFLS